jgi:S-adenosylmethionine-diacylglycerol 3-amino-3-carboxypropyl transferase
MPNELLKKAAENSPAASKRGLLERGFTFLFQGFVYNQIWEDPDVDIKAMRVGPETRIFTISSGGCNILNYLAVGPKSITAIDLNPNHLALARLKLCAVENLPDYETFFRFFGEGRDRRNVVAYRQYLEPKLDPETRAYWNSRLGLFGRKIDMFARDFYSYSLLGKFIGWLHFGARWMYGLRTSEILSAQSMDEQRRIFDGTWSRVFDSRFVKWITKLPAFYYMLGIPPQQFDELVAEAKTNPASIMRARMEKLACDFPIEDNYFAWQAFGRHYDTQKRHAVPDYLRADTWPLLRGKTGNVDINHVLMTPFLAEKPQGAFDRFVLLDSQDWMNEQMTTELWEQITRIAEPGARVIFRTAGPDSALEKKLPAEMMAKWHYEAEESAAFHRQDRSSIYGGFHIYERRAA